MTHKFVFILLIAISESALSAQSATHFAARRDSVAHNQDRVGQSGHDFAQLREQAEGGNAAAQLKLARAYESGTDAPQDVGLAVMWYRRAAEQGNSEAQDALGEKCLIGQGVEKSAVEAVSWFRKSARQGNSGAMYHLGAAYYNGVGVQIDDALSYAWFRLAKEAGDKRAAEAVERAESALKPQTITIGLEKIAQMYEKDGSLPESQPEAARWWSVAAARGDEDAKVGMAFNMLSAQGVPEDLNKARHACSEAAKQQNHRAEYCMGYIYEHGLGVTPNAKRARNWYGLAAAKGEMEAMRTLALMEIKGEGGKVDRIDAFLLYARLLEIHDRDALRYLVKLRSEITLKEWELLQKPLVHMRIDPSKLDHVLQNTAAQ
jgi:TPR repeat protein